jgi:predicted lipid-binding transport protein (Tim44 family)
LLPMMLVISIVMGIVPLLGIAWTIATGTVTTVDGLFMSLILLTLSAVFFLNAFWELRDRGALSFLDKKKVAAAATSAAAPKVTTNVTTKDTTKETPKAAAPAAPANAAPPNAAPAPANKDPKPEEAEG